MVERTVNWTGVAYPNAGWATQVFGEPDVERLWEAVAFCTRLDETDPVEAWRAHMARLESRAAKLTSLELDACTTAARAPTSPSGCSTTRAGCRALFHTASGIEYVPNMPTEEIFTTPDSRRAEGTIRSSRPLALLGDIVEGLQLTVRDGKIVDVQADKGADVVRGQLGERRARRVLRRARSRRRHVARRRDGTSRSSTRSSTRTRRVTSPTASGSPRSSTASPARE